MQLLRESYKIKLQILKLISKFDTINEINSNTLLVNYHPLMHKMRSNPRQNFLDPYSKVFPI